MGVDQGALIAPADINSRTAFAAADRIQELRKSNVTDSLEEAAARIASNEPAGGTFDGDPLTIELR